MPFLAVLGQIANMLKIRYHFECQEKIVPNLYRLIMIPCQNRVLESVKHGVISLTVLQLSGVPKSGSPVNLERILKLGILPHIINNVAKMTYPKKT